MMIKQQKLDRREKWMQDNNTQPPNTIRKIGICYVQLATIRTFL